MKRPSPSLASSAAYPVPCIGVPGQGIGGPVLQLVPSSSPGVNVLVYLIAHAPEPSDDVKDDVAGRAAWALAWARAVIAHLEYENGEVQS